jgi:hypothetical protein
MEARQDEARQAHPEGRAQMPGVDECRLALAIHGERDNFRTITLEFDDPEQARWFDAQSDQYGVGVMFVTDPTKWSPIEGVQIKRVTR